MRHRRPLAATLIVAIFALVAGCGDDSATTTTTVPVETVDPLPKLPHNWKPVRSDQQGLAMGRAPGWVEGRRCLTAEGHHAPKNAEHVLVLCSPDLLTTLSVVADRTPGGLDVPVNEFAQRAFQGLNERQYDGALRGGAPQSFGSPYEAAAVEGSGRIPHSGFDSDVEVIVLRREGLANFTVVIASNASKASAAQLRQAEKMVQTLRDSPAQGKAGRGAHTP